VLHAFFQCKSYGTGHHLTRSGSTHHDAESLSAGTLCTASACFSVTVQSSFYTIKKRRCSLNISYKKCRLSHGHNMGTMRWRYSGLLMKNRLNPSHQLIMPSFILNHLVKRLKGHRHARHFQLGHFIAPADSGLTYQFAEASLCHLPTFFLWLRRVQKKKYHDIHV